ncbi:MAG: zinc ABC transporter substrate-binding protein [Acetobacteraceae bacterium]|nr:zinc ABC transporter substrate-binding protein [Acetobacteraceae bacterium]
MNSYSRIGRRSLLAAPLLALPLPAAAQGAAAPPTIVSTVAMVGDLVREIGGDRVRAETLLGEGVDPHTYRPTRADIARLNAADMIFYNGLLLEGQMTDVFVRIARTGKPVFAVTELLAAPQDAEVFRRNGEDLARRLSALDAYIKRVIGSVPEQRRVLVTAHDAFGYFARRYGIAVEGIQGLSTEAEAGVRRIQDLVDMLVERRVQAVFIETSVNDRNVRAVIEGAGAKGHRVAIGGALFSDAMGAPGSYEGTYVGMMDHNATIIARALGGEAPARGLNGRLAG